MASTYGFGIHVYGCNVQVGSESSKTSTILDRYVFPSLPRLVSAADKPDVLIRLDDIADQSELSVNGVVTALGSDANSLVPELIRVLDEAVLERLTMLRAVHAGAVQLGERVLLLPGATHAGKSSLVAELLKRGATYFSDEYALIDSSGCVHPYPRPLLLRNGGPEQSPALPGEWNALVGERPAPVGWILSLDYLRKSMWSVAPVNQSEGLLILLRNTPHVLGESPEILRVFQRVAAGARCYVGRRGEAADAADHILQLVGGSAGF